MSKRYGPTGFSCATDFNSKPSSCPNKFKFSANHGVKSSASFGHISRTYTGCGCCSVEATASSVFPDAAVTRADHKVAAVPV